MFYLNQFPIRLYCLWLFGLFLLNFIKHFSFFFGLRILEGRRKKRKATRNTNKRWPNKEVPYIITDDFSKFIVFYKNLDEVRIKSFDWTSL